MDNEQEHLTFPIEGTSAETSLIIRSDGGIVGLSIFIGGDERLEGDLEVILPLVTCDEVIQAIERIMARPTPSCDGASAGQEIIYSVDQISSSEAFVIVRGCSTGHVGLTVSIRSGGDIETFATPTQCTSILQVLKRAIQHAPRNSSTQGSFL